MRARERPTTRRWSAYVVAVALLGLLLLLVACGLWSLRSEPLVALWAVVPVVVSFVVSQVDPIFPVLYVVPSGRVWIISRGSPTRLQADPAAADFLQTFRRVTVTSYGTTHVSLWARHQFVPTCRVIR